MRQRLAEARTMDDAELIEDELVNQEGLNPSTVPQLPGSAYVPPGRLSPGHPPGGIRAD